MKVLNTMQHMHAEEWTQCKYFASPTAICNNTCTSTKNGHIQQTQMFCFTNRPCNKYVKACNIKKLTFMWYTPYERNMYGTREHDQSCSCLPMHTWNVRTHSAKARCNGVYFNLLYVLIGSNVSQVVWPEQAKAKHLLQQCKQPSKQGLLLIQWGFKWKEPAPGQHIHDISLLSQLNSSW